MTKYSPEITEEICKRISVGKSLVKVCKELDIDYGNVFDWLAKDPAFSDNYARAREAQADFHADAIVDIADDEPDHNKARVRIDARKWVAGKMKPKKYGDKSTQEITGADGGPVQHTHAVRYIKPDGIGS